jgi:NADH dehydrogenase
MDRDTHSIVIVGGGFAGTALARALDAQRPPGLQVTLISDESTTTFNPMLPEAVGASVFPEHVVAPLREMLDFARGDRFVMGRLTDVDARARTVRCETLAGTRELRYDELVLAFGNRARLDVIPGMALHALPLKTVGDAMHIRNVVLRRLACIELESDARLRRELGHFVVIGGGFSGVEVAGELVDCLASIRRYYPRVAADELQVTLLHDLDRLLPEMSPRLAAAALRSLRRRGVAVELNARAASIDERGARLEDGRALAAQTVISTIGTRPNSLATELGLATERGRVIVDPDLAVPNHDHLWALGDCALVPNGFDGRAHHRPRSSRCARPGSSPATCWRAAAARPRARSSRGRAA